METFGRVFYAVYTVSMGRHVARSLFYYIFLKKMLHPFIFPNLYALQKFPRYSYDT